MNKEQTVKKVSNIMEEVNAAPISTCNGPNKSQLVFWNVSGHIVIVQFWPEGGCNHFVDGKGNTWDEMITQLHQIAAITKAEGQS